jgi:hypothetical protein
VLIRGAASGPRSIQPHRCGRIDAAVPGELATSSPAPRPAGASQGFIRRDAAGHQLRYLLVKVDAQYAIELGVGVAAPEQGTDAKAGEVQPAAEHRVLVRRSGASAGLP